MLTRDRSFYRSFLKLCLALMLEQAVILSVNLADNLMLGTYSQAALSGVSAVNQVQFVFHQIVFAIGTIVITLGSQYWGEGRVKEIRKAASAGIRVEAFFALLVFALVSLFPQGTLRLFTDNADYISEGVKYLMIMRFSYVFFAVTAVLLSSMRTVEVVKIALRVSFISLIINVCINYVLIAGRFGAPELGVEGAAIGTLTARAAEFVIVFAFVLKDKKLGFRLPDLLGSTGTMFADFVRVGIPVIIAAAVWGLSNALQTVVLGHMNDSTIAAQSISNTAFMLLKVTAVGASSAGAVLIGKTVGEGDRDRLHSYTRTLQVIFAGIGVLTALLMLAVRMPLLGIYKPKITPETYEIAGAYMLIQSAVLFFSSYQMPVNTGIIRGGGDTHFVLILDVIAICTFLPLAFLGARLWGWSPIAVIICLNMDQPLKCIPAFFRVNTYGWVKKLTRGES